MEGEKEGKRKDTFSQTWVLLVHTASSTITIICIYYYDIYYYY